MREVENWDISWYHNIEKTEGFIKAEIGNSATCLIRDCRFSGLFLLTSRSFSQVRILIVILFPNNYLPVNLLQKEAVENT